ncbi:pyrroline-5-carboxylate reductase [Nitrospira sp.]|nr:pyrroline-5-carboxylate reductase [Nitrospira sp.]
MLTDQTTGFIGAGNMTEALIGGVLHGGHATAAQLFASDPRVDRRDGLKRRYGLHVTADNREVASRSSLLVLSVEPQVLDEVLAEIATSVPSHAVIISVAAGYPISRLAKGLPNHAGSLVRAMPNTPSSVRAGVTALAFSADLGEQNAQRARALFECVGQVVTVEERLMDAVTGLSGSGPAYIFVLIEALADGGVKAGLPRPIAEVLAAQTVLGAAKMVQDTGEHPARLKDRVASPGGTTIAGLHVLEQGRVRATLMSAVEAAAKRSAELGLGDENSS